MKDTTQALEKSPLISNLMQLVHAHRRAFKQERPFLRAMALVFSELFNFARHTVTQGLLTLGLAQEDLNAWYRLFSRERFDEQVLGECTLQETLEHVKLSEPYVTAIDGTSIHRTSLKMPGTHWLIDKRFSAFRPGIHRAQRFLHGAWLTPIEDGYSRAVPLRLLPAFPPKAQASQEPSRREWEAGLSYLAWLRNGLDQAGRQSQMLLALADGAFDVVDLWKDLPERTILITRTARNRCLYWLPQPDASPGPGRPALYGEKAPHPAKWLHSGLRNWPKNDVVVRGRSITMRYQVLGPFLRETLPDRPMFLIVVKGMHRKKGKKGNHYKHVKPSFYLVSAIQQNDQWVLPLPIQTILEWLWQRWEIEVAHREMKSGMGVGEKQCWNKRSAVVSVQWGVWVYAVFILAGYRSWGLLGGPSTPARWWPGSKRWSISTLWRSFRAELWGASEFRPLCIGTCGNWWEKEDKLASLTNSIAAASRI